jgi:hypothetical protein
MDFKLKILELSVETNLKIFMINILNWCIKTEVMGYCLFDDKSSYGHSPGEIIPRLHSGM